MLTSQNDSTQLPIAIIGAGPVGLAAAAHLAAKGEPFVVFEASPTIAGSVRAWGHVRMFSPWKYNIDEAAAALLVDAGWSPPTGDNYPTGAELAAEYLTPLATLPVIAPSLQLGTEVRSISRLGTDKLKSAGRGDLPFAIHTRDAAGNESQTLARAIIDASGTYRSPNPLGADGVPAAGEADVAGRIFSGIPDARGALRARYAGKRVLVVGGGHSAFNALIDLAAIAETGSEIHWAIRSETAATLYGGGLADQLPERGSLGLRLRELVDAGEIHLESGFRAGAIRETADGVIVSDGDRSLPPVDEVIVATGFRPDLAMTRELRLNLDDVVESPAALAPLIDPNLHSCGTVPPHGAMQLAHPEPNYYSVGMKSYGRAPTFLMMTGYEQVRSVVAALTGDLAGAREVRLVLPETGVCSGSGGSDESACCGGPAPAEADACCALDAEAKASGADGCGCGTVHRDTSLDLVVINAGGGGKCC